MKKVYITTVFSVACLFGASLFTGCSDEFLKEKQNYDNLSPEIYNDYTGAKMRVEDIYLRLLPSANTSLTYRYPSSGKSDTHSKSTEEFSGLSSLTDPDVVVNPTSNLDDFFHVNKATNAGPWGEIRNCNDVIEGISNGTLPDEQKDELLGQVYFFRAWQYYLLVKTYGGVPIVDKVQATDVSQTEGLAVPRATTKACIDFICEGLELAAGMLPSRWDGDNFGRITKGAALALAGRARLLYAGPLFNRADDATRWRAAYDANKDAIEALKAGGFGLAYESDPGINASGWAKMLYEFNSDEAVFVTLYNKLNDNNDSHEVYRNNHWEQSIRPSNASNATSSGMTPTAMMIDLFPMADGKKPGESSYAYDQLKFFKNRDPRFYRTFAFPGVTWTYDGDITGLSDVFEFTGSEYVLWNYAWYANDEKKDNVTQSGYGASGLGLNNKGLYVRKRSNDFDMTTPAPVTMYRWDVTNRQGAFGEGAMPYMEIRYAEVLLNLAEAACGIGEGAEALGYLRDIRKRVGYTGDCGLDDALAGDRGQLFGAILYERQVELAYEGKRFEDMRRWLLWDGGANMSQISGAPSSWTLTGFGGNTCTYTGVTPFNGKRRDNVELVSKTNADESAGKDPIKSARDGIKLDLKTELSGQYAALETFYDNNLTRKTRQGDQADRYVTFKPEYYIIGLTEGAQKNNVSLLQTIGWADVRAGSGGTFDPLAE